MPRGPGTYERAESEISTLSGGVDERALHRTEVGVSRPQRQDRQAPIRQVGHHGRLRETPGLFDDRSRGELAFKLDRWISSPQVRSAVLTQSAG